jgi:hypothetical protein
LKHFPSDLVILEEWILQRTMRNSDGKVRPGRGPADNEPLFDISANFGAIFGRLNNQ